MEISRDATSFEPNVEDMRATEVEALRRENGETRGPVPREAAAVMADEVSMAVQITGGGIEATPRDLPGVGTCLHRQSECEEAIGKWKNYAIFKSILGRTC